LVTQLNRATEDEMKIFAAGLQTETNTFAPWPTGLRAFTAGGTCRGEVALAGTAPEHATARLWRDLSLRDAHQFHAGLFANAETSGPTVQSVYESLRDDILEDLRARDGIDVVLLFLHGAMIATGCEDCEADLVQHVRAVVGSDAIIGVELDPHCHLTQDLLDVADAVILMKLFPHDDYLARGRELYDICTAAKRGEVDLVTALFDCRMVGIYPTTQEPMASLVERFRAVERIPGILSASFAHGFPWGDTPEAGSRVLVIADGDRARAEQVAQSVGREIYGAREALLPRFPSMNTALDEATNTPGLVVLADIADNAGGGAPSDNVSFLRTMLKRGMRDAAVGAIWDPVVANVCVEAGVGACLALRLGGKCGAASGEPLDIHAVVRGCRENHSQSGLGDSVSPLGLTVWIEIDGIDVIVNTMRTQVYSPEVFTGLGIRLERKKIVVVKSSQHFYTRFTPIASKIILVSTPGLLDMNFAGLHYVRKRDLEYYPRVSSPLG
jgi:microcystin degradation protein MlrC